MSRKYLTTCLALLVHLTVANAQGDTGYIQILADEGVSVFLDGRLAGRTNTSNQGLVLTDVPVGSHRLRFEKGGFKPYLAKLAVSAGKVEVYTLYSPVPNINLHEEDIERTGFLDARTGTIEIFCLPVYCAIDAPSLGLENYEKKSSALVLQDVLATHHQIAIRVGGRYRQKTVNLAADTKLRLFADFSGEQPHFRTSISKLKVRQLPVPEPRVQTQFFEVTVEQPLAVVLDNTDPAYPQQGLIEASSVFEMPIEAGATYLMSVYTRADPAQVGPIRGVRDYFLEAALAMNGTLVHIGGSPSAMNRIASDDLATVDALQDGALFAQAPDRAAPHSTFSTGAILRDAIGRLQNDVSGVLYIPPGNTPNVATVTVNYSSDYTSGFHYLPDIGQYRWRRSGMDAADAAQTSVTADAVVVAKVVAFPYPDDPEGRLYLPYSGGEATLYLRGKAVLGSWTSEGGFTFVSSTGEKVDLTPFKSWILFAPEETQVSTQ